MNSPISGSNMPLPVFHNLFYHTSAMIPQDRAPYNQRCFCGLGRVCWQHEDQKSKKTYQSLPYM